MAESVPTDASQLSSQTGVVFTRGGVVTVDSPFQVDGGSGSEVSTMLHVGNGGDIVWKYADGSFGAMYNVSPDRFIPVKAIKVVSSGTVNGTSISTTASNITWHGGA